MFTVAWTPDLYLNRMMEYWLVRNAFRLKVVKLFPQQVQTPVKLRMRSVKGKSKPVAVFLAV